LSTLNGILIPLAVGGSPTGLQGLYYWHHLCSTLGGRRVLVLGAGEAGALVVREIEANPRLGLKPVAFADDEPAKLGAQIEALFRPLWLGTDDNLWEKETWLASLTNSVADSVRI
jgi:hypothetical protein